MSAGRLRPYGVRLRGSIHPWDYTDAETAAQAATGYAEELDILSGRVLGASETELVVEVCRMRDPVRFSAFIARPLIGTRPPTWVATRLVEAIERPRGAS